MTLAADASQTDIDVEWRAPSGRIVRTPAFRDTRGRWIARFVPRETGRWKYAVVGCEAARCPGGEVSVTRPPRDEFVRIDASGVRPRFALAAGRSFIGIGDTSYGIVNGVPDRMLARYVRTRAAQGFNFVRLFAAGMPYRIHRELRADDAWPWGGTPQNPDYDRLNPRFFQRLERVVAQFHAAGIRTEMLLFNYYSEPFRNPASWTPARQRLWLRELMARFASNPAVFMWTVTNEYELYPDGRYRYDAPGDDDWVRDVARQVHELDPEHHPVTAHNFTFDADGGVATRFRAASLDVLSQQAWGNATWLGRYLHGDASGVDATIRKDLPSGMPVVNTENGYEWLEGFYHFNQQVNSTVKMRRAAWRALLGGASAYAAGFAATWHGNDDYIWEEAGPLKFEVRDMGWGSQVRHLREFLRYVDLARFEPVTTLLPAENPALGRNGEEFVAYAPGGGRLDLDLRHVAHDLCLRWFDPRRGSMTRCNRVAGGAHSTITAPSPDDWVLWLRRE